MKIGPKRADPGTEHFETRKKIKQGLYKLADLNGSNNVVEEDLKATYFNKWKQEEEQKEAAFRNERYAKRLRVNGYRD